MIKDYRLPHLSRYKKVRPLQMGTPPHKILRTGLIRIPIELLKQGARAIYLTQKHPLLPFTSSG